MFTGLVEEVGTVVDLAGRGSTRRLRVRARRVLEDSPAGASLAVSGACLTVVAREGDVLSFDLGPETLARTMLGRLGPGDGVNLERPLRLGAALGGHLVLGHVDAVAAVEKLERVESTTRVRVRLPDRDLAAWLIPQGSVAVDGVSLTVAALDDVAFEVMLVPHTLAVTTLGRLRAGSAVNVEADVIGKYVARALALRGAR